MTTNNAQLFRTDIT